MKTREEFDDQPEILKEMLKSGAEAVGVQLDAQMINKLLLYFSELKEWNRKINLISLKDDASIITDHFIDSLSAVPYLPKTGRLLDAGSGAGLPGLPIKIARPALDVILVESRRKKINFLRHVILLLNLSNVIAWHSRIERLPSETNMSGFDIVIARALTKLEKLLHVAYPLLQSGGYLVIMKGKEGFQELQKNRAELKALSMEVIKHVELQLPVTNKKRSLFLIRKM